VVIQRWTLSRLRESSAAPVGQRELNPLSRLRRMQFFECSKAWVMVIMMENALLHDSFRILVYPNR